MRKLLIGLLLVLGICSQAWAGSFTSAAGGNWNASATWGKTGDPAVEGTDYPGNTDTASIGHAVVVNGVYPASGDIGAITITNGGTLSFIYTATTKIKTAGVLTVNSGGTLSIGTVANPIGSSYTATLEFDCASAGQYGLSIASGGILNAQGNPLSYYRTTLSSAITADDVHCHTTDTTGWAIGDVIIVSTTSTTIAQTEEVIITGISGTTIYIDSNGNGTGATPKFTYAHAADAEVAILTHNAKITATNTAYKSYISIAGTSNMDWVEISEMGSNNSGKYGVSTNGASSAIDNCSIYNAYQCLTASTSMNHSNLIFYNAADKALSTAPQYGVFTGCSFANVNYGFYFSGGSRTSLIFTNCNFYGLNNAWYHGTYYDSSLERDSDILWVGCKFWSAGASGWGAIRNECIVTGQTTSYGMKFVNCELGVLASNTIDIATFYNSAPRIYRAYNTKFNSASTLTIANGAELRSHNHGNISGRYKVIRGYGIISDQVTGGQAAAWANGGSGICVYLNPTSTTAGQTLNWEFNIPVTASTDPQIKVYVKKTSSGANCTLNLDVYDSDDNTLLINNASVTLTDSWGQYSVASITPSATGYVRCVLKALDGGTTGDIGIDDISIVISGTTCTDALNNWKDALPQLQFDRGGGAASNTIIVDEGD